MAIEEILPTVNPLSVLGARRIINTLIGEGEVLNDPEGHKRHLETAAEIAVETVGDANRNYSWMSLNEGDCRLAALYHDVGRLLASNQLFHELRGAGWLESLAEHYGVGGFALDKNGIKLKMIAQVVRSHGAVYERFTDPELSAADQKVRAEFACLDEQLLIPSSWEAAIVAVAEMQSTNDGRTSVREKIEGNEKKYDDNPVYASSAVVRSIVRAKPRLLEMDRLVCGLREGTLSDEELGKYSFRFA